MALENAVFDNISARNICLVDSDGKIRLRLALATDGSPTIQLNDASGRPRLDIQLGSYGNPSITFFSVENEALLGMGLSEEMEGAGITMWSAGDAKHHLTIGVDRDGVHHDGI